MDTLIGLAEECDRAGSLSDAESEILGVRINEALGIASYITDDGNPVLSLDSAMQLVPEGWDWLTRNDVPGRAFAHVNKDFHSIVMVAGGRAVDQSTGQSFPVYAATPALALCAAALRARAAK